MEQQTVEVKFRGELVGSHTDSSATYTLYRVPDGMYVVHVDKGEESWLESHGKGSTTGWSERSSRSWPQRPDWIEA